VGLAIGPALAVTVVQGQPAGAMLAPAASTVRCSYERTGKCHFVGATEQTRDTCYACKVGMLHHMCMSEFYTGLVKQTDPSFGGPHQADKSGCATFGGQDRWCLECSQKFFFACDVSDCPVHDAALDITHN
jgi:hypothetical protein